MFLYQDPRLLLSAELLERILLLLKSSDAPDGLTTFERVIEMLGKKDSVPPPALRRHMMWLLKYGLISVDSAPPGSQGAVLSGQIS
ncbi:MAG TPA: hypothetical protein VFJ58_23910 [Armatimonadota bacterium]|nr:hypothetical protein [Armatimonadota bacterium]